MGIFKDQTSQEQGFTERLTWVQETRLDLAPLMRPTKCPDIPVSLKRNTEVFTHHFL